MILYFDTETSGLRPGQICQLSYVMQEGLCTTAKNFFFTVDFVEYGAFCVHGFSVEKLKVLSNGKRFADYFSEIQQDFDKADVIVGHNVSFDISFMRAEYQALGKIFFVNNEFCTMKKTTPVCKLPRNSGVGYKYPKLNELCTHLSISDGDILRATKALFGAQAGFHDARFDTTAVFLAVNRGIEYISVFKELEKFL